MSTTKSDIVRVVDIETTGLDPATDRIVEIAVVVVDFQGQHYRKLFHSLVDPGIPIPPEASAVHHITTAMVAGKAPTPDRIRPALEALADPAIPWQPPMPPLTDRSWLPPLATGHRPGSAPCALPDTSGPMPPRMATRPSATCWI